jgi:hypothetical protein
MTLLDIVLRGTLFQQMLATKSHDIVAIRPHILKVGSPGGTLKIQTTDINGELIAESNTVNISSIGTLSNFHGYVRFDINFPVLTGKAFRVQLVAGGGYTASDAAFISWVLDYDLRRYIANYEPSTGENSPFDVEFWQQRTIGMVRELDFADGFESSSQPSGDTQFNLTNNQAGAADITGLSFAFATTQSNRIGYSIYRTDGAIEKRASGTFKVQYKPVAASWDLEDEREFDTDTGVVFSIDGTGQIQYTTDDLAGQTIGYIKYSVNETFSPGV